MSEEKRLALLIDSDNISAKNATFILQEAMKYGNLIYKRIYGDWEKTNNGWRIPATNNSILQIQQNSYIAGKNATDFSIVIDAMDILYSGNVDGFVLVTSDSDFTRLAIRLRESGKLVIGIGSVQTPLAFSSSCHKFIYINVPKESHSDITAEKLQKDVLEFVKNNDDGKLDLYKINAFLNGRYGTVDYNALGFNRLSAFIDNIPKLKRRGNYVTSTDSQNLKEPDAVKILPTEKEIVELIAEYLKRQSDCKDDISRINDYVTKTFGKVDFGRFGSKHFSKFIDRHYAEFSRLKNTVTLKTKQKPTETEQPSAVAQNIPDDKPSLRITEQLFAMEVRKYAEENDPDGGNLGQLNNMLLEKYGKEYIAELGCSDFTTALADVPGIKTVKNFVYIDKHSQNTPVTKNSAENAKPAEKKRGKKATVPAEKAPAEKARVEKSPVEETPVEETPVEQTLVEKAAEKPSPKKENTKQKPEINAVKRDILGFAAENSGGSLPELGKLLNEKYGRGYLKEIGFTTMKKLIASMNGLYEKSNALYLDEDFVSNTDQIEQLVYDYAHSSGKRSIKALSSLIKKTVEDFDFTDYGYSKFSDFINAIDGVRANGYYVEADNEDS